MVCVKAKKVYTFAWFVPMVRDGLFQGLRRCFIACAKFRRVLSVKWPVLECKLAEWLPDIFSAMWPVCRLLEKLCHRHALSCCCPWTLLYTWIYWHADSVVAVFTRHYRGSVIDLLTSSLRCCYSCLLFYNRVYWHTVFSLIDIVVIIWLPHWSVDISMILPYPSGVL